MTTNAENDVLRQALDAYRQAQQEPVPKAFRVVFSWIKVWV